jgi:hypothetical protein
MYSTLTTCTTTLYGDLFACAFFVADHAGQIERVIWLFRFFLVYPDKIVGTFDKALLVL